MTTVLPIAKQIEYELSHRLDVPIKLRFDEYARDMAGRAASFAKMVQGGMSTDKAAAISGLLIDAE